MRGHAITLLRPTARCERPGCRNGAHWYLHDEGTWLCEEHSMEALRGGWDEVRAIVDDDLITLNERGELERAS